MTVTVDATYQNGMFKSAQPVASPEGAKVRLLITPIEDKDVPAKQATPAAQASEQVRPAPVFVWSKTMYRARKAAQEFAKETHADY